jgi:hypothetical protein
MTAEPSREVRYPFITNGAVRVWSIPFRGDEPGDAIQVTHNPQAADIWQGTVCSGGWLRRLLEEEELAEALRPYELRDAKGKRYR